MTQAYRNQKIQPHWWSKVIIALVLGLSLAYALIGIFAWQGPGGIDAPVKVQFNMWMLCLLWLMILSFSFMFKTRWSALCYLGGANLVAYLGYLAARLLS
jgi:hypothetical protein